LIRLRCRFVRHAPARFGEALPSRCRTLAALAGDAELASQVLERSRAMACGVTDLALGDGHADADIHRNAPAD